MHELSIVIRTRNSEEIIGKCLESLRSQTFKSYEIIIVDNDSSDSTSNIAKKFCVNKIKNISKKDFSFGKSLNIGFKESTGAYLCSLSPHCFLCDDNSLETLFSNIKASSSDTVGGYGRIAFSEDTRHFADNKQEVIDISMFSEEPTSGLRNPFSLIKREYWEKFNFPENTTCEDQIWAYHYLKKGFRTICVRDAVCYYNVTNSFAYLLKKHFIEASTIYKYRAVAPKSLPYIYNAARQYGACALDSFRKWEQKKFFIAFNISYLFAKYLFMFYNNYNRKTGV